MTIDGSLIFARGRLAISSIVFRYMINLKKEEKEEDSSQSLNLAVNTLYRACMYVCVNITASTQVIYLHIDIEAFER